MGENMYGKLARGWIAPGLTAVEPAAPAAVPAHAPEVKVEKVAPVAAPVKLVETSSPPKKVEFVATKITPVVADE